MENQPRKSLLPLIVVAAGIRTSFRQSLHLRCKSIHNISSMDIQSRSMDRHVHGHLLLSHLLCSSTTPTPGRKKSSHLFFSIIEY
uniref:Uncharacterized protein n=1 Tax=Arundo donax TaxID=35708 RepID=A0A0A9GZP2_ARUDO